MENPASIDRESSDRRAINSSPALESRGNNEPLADSSGIAYWTCVVLGVSSLIPWNLFITAHGYFSYKFRDTNSSGFDNSTASVLENAFEMYFALAGSTCGMLGSIVNICLRLWLSANLLMVSGHALVGISLIASLVFSFVDTDDWQIGFLWLNIGFILISQIGCVIMSGGVFAIAALLRETRFTNAVISAQAACGIFTSLTNIVSMSIGSDNRPALVGGVYFSVALAMVLFSLAMYFVFLRNSYAQYYIAKPGARNDDTDPLIVDAQSEEGDSDSATSQTGAQSGGHGPLVVFKKTFYHGSILTIIMVGTMSSFPALTSLVRSTSPKTSTWSNYFVPVACFLLFNTMDFIGRLLGNFTHWPKPGSIFIGIFAVVRFGFLPLFLYCNLVPESFISEKSQIFSDDFYFVLFMTLFGLSNGYLANLAAMYLPYDLSERDREKAGAATAFYLSSGVLMGSVASLCIVRAVLGHW